MSGHRKLDVKQLFCLCGFAFLGFALWLSFIPVTNAPVNPMVSQAIRVHSIRARLTQVRQQQYQATGDYAQAVLAVAPDVDAMQRVIHQTSDSWAILSRDPEVRPNAKQFQLSLAVMQDEGRIYEKELLIARMMQQVGPEMRQELLHDELLPLMNQEQVVRERFQEYRSRPEI